MAPLKKLFPFLGILLAAGCASISVQTDYNRQTNFANYTSFNWMPHPADVGKNPFLQNTLFKERVENAIQMALEAQGYPLNTSGTASFLVAYHAGLQDKSELVDMGPAWGYDMGPWGWDAGFWQPDYETINYTESTLIIDFIDAKTNKLIWRGWATDAVSSPEESANEINEVVQKIIAKYPPQPSQ
jgi:hypothetical protein